MSTLKVGDRVKISKWHQNINLPINKYLTVHSISADGLNVTCLEIPNTSIETEYLELANVLKPGLFFKKDNNLYMITESVNQRWLVNLSSGELKWISPTNTDKTVNDLKGYSPIELPKEIFNVVARINS